MSSTWHSKILLLASHFSQAVQMKGFQKNEKVGAVQSKQFNIK